MVAALTSEYGKQTPWLHAVRDTGLCRTRASLHKLCCQQQYRLSRICNLVRVGAVAGLGKQGRHTVTGRSQVVQSPSCLFYTMHALKQRLVSSPLVIASWGGTHPSLQTHCSSDLAPKARVVWSVGQLRQTWTSPVASTPPGPYFPGGHRLHESPPATDRQHVAGG